MDRKTKFRLAAAIAWAVSLALLMLAISILDPILWIMFAPMVMLIGSAGLLILLTALAATRSPQGWIGVGTIVVVCLYFLINFDWFVSVGDGIVFQRNFARMEERYLEIIAVAQRDQNVPMNEEGCTAQQYVYWVDEPFSYVVDRGPPIRVAFPQGGIIDNWNGVVYDPTGIVKSATGWAENYQYTATLEAKTLFGGDLVYCEHVKDAFYRCWFT